MKFNVKIVKWLKQINRLNNIKNVKRVGTKIKITLYKRKKNLNLLKFLSLIVTILNDFLLQIKVLKNK